MSATAEPVVSIVIRCRDEAASLGAVLDAVFAQEGAPDFEVIALDSGSRDDTLSVLARYRVRLETERGPVIATWFDVSSRH